MKKDKLENKVKSGRGIRLRKDGTFEIYRRKNDTNRNP
jgi:nucleoid DNA-binding protein